MSAKFPRGGGGGSRTFFSLKSNTTFKLFSSSTMDQNYNQLEKNSACMACKT